MSRKPPRLFGGKRLYKKKWHLGEFSIYGFSIKTEEKISDVYVNYILDKFIILPPENPLALADGMNGGYLI